MKLTTQTCKERRLLLGLVTACLVAAVWPVVGHCEGSWAGASGRILESLSFRVLRLHLLGTEATQGAVHQEASIPAADRSAIGADRTPVREVEVFGRPGVVLELGRIGPDGRFVRPRLLVGRQSPELKFWLRENGIEAERCMLPLLRTRARRDADTGRLGATVMISARCTFY